jgi:hypothetical protein
MGTSYRSRHSGQDQCETLEGTEGAEPTGKTQGGRFEASLHKGGTPKAPQTRDARRRRSKVHESVERLRSSKSLRLSSSIPLLAIGCQFVYYIGGTCCNFGIASLIWMIVVLVIVGRCQLTQLESVEQLSPSVLYRPSCF